MKLLECIMVVDEQPRCFEFEGNVEIDTENYSEPYLEFYDLVIYEKKGEDRDLFNPKGATWAGKKIDCEYAIRDVIARYSRNEKQVFDMKYLCEELSNYLNPYKNNIALTVNGREIPNKVIYDDYVGLFELSLVTDKFAYYINDDATLMLDSNTGVVISDNYFAEVGFWDSLEAVDNGTEINLFGDVDELRGDEKKNDVIPLSVDEQIADAKQRCGSKKGSTEKSNRIDEFSFR